jgi:hypothetical protein
MSVSALVLWISMLLGGAQGTREQAIDVARTELARALGVDPASLALVDAREREWRDASLGCPQRGVVYAQVVTPGYAMTFRSGTARYSMHVGGGRAVRCGTPIRGDARDGKIVRGGALEGLKMAEQARADLATRLGVPTDQVTIDFFRPTTWPDERLGCDTTDTPPSPQPTRGFVIQLSSGGKTYEYHSDVTRVVSCKSEF